MTTANYWKDTGTEKHIDSGTEAWKTAADYMTHPVILLVEPWGLKLGIDMDEYYGDVLTPLILIEEYYFDAQTPVHNLIELYGDALVPLIGLNELYDDISTPSVLIYESYNDIAAPLVSFIEPYSDALPISILIEQTWTIFEDILALVVEPYAITDTIVKLLFVEPYELEQYNKVTKLMEEPYYLLTDNSYISAPTASLTVNGQEIEFLTINITAGINQYCLIGDITLPSEVEYFKCNAEDEAICVINGDTYILFVETKERNMANNGMTYSLSLLSPTAKLDAPYSKTIVESFISGIYVEDLIQQMANYEGITVDYQILNWFLPPSVISINDETPLEVIRKVVNSVGAVVQTKPNGDLLIISEYPVSPSVWNITTPSVIFDKSADLLNENEFDIINTGYNAFIISDEGSSSDNILLREENINETTKIIKGFRIPFEEGEFDLETSGGIEVTLDKYIYPIEEQVPLVDADEEWEIIEFVDWVGSTASPIYAIVDYDWIEEDLGTFSFSENGTLTIDNQSIVPGESLLRIKYTTKYWRWTVTGPSAKNVQFYVPEEV